MQGLSILHTTKGDSRLKCYVPEFWLFNTSKLEDEFSPTRGECYYKCKEIFILIYFYLILESILLYFR